MRNPLYTSKVCTLYKPNVLAAAGNVNAAWTIYVDMGTCRSGAFMGVLDAGTVTHNIENMVLWDCVTATGTYVLVPGVTITDLEGDGANMGDASFGDGRPYLVHVPYFRRFVALLWDDVGAAGSYFGAWLIGVNPVQAPVVPHSATSSV